MRRVYISGAALFLGGALLCGGCTKRIYVPMERYVMTTDTLRQTAVRVDSVWERDSIYVEARGDTLTREVYRWRYRERLIHDTIRERAAAALIERQTEQTPAEPSRTTLGRRLSKLAEGIALAVGSFAVLLLLILYIRWRRRR